MKEVQQQCCTLGRVRPAPLARPPEVAAMLRSARLFLCARCRDQVLLCSHYDHGQLYCGRACSAASRHERRREVAQRYQRSRGGRLKHAARSACWRARRSSHCHIGAGDNTNKVTHQGCPASLGNASLVSCDTPSPCELRVLTESVSLDAPAPATARVLVPALWVCRRCAHALLPFVRLERLRWRGLGRRNRHDHPS